MNRSIFTLIILSLLILGGLPIHTTANYPDNFNQIELHPTDTDQYAVFVENRYIFIYSIKTGEALNSVDLNEVDPDRDMYSYSSLSWSPDGKYISVTNGPLYIFETENLTLVTSIDDKYFETHKWSSINSSYVSVASSYVSLYHFNESTLNLVWQSKTIAEFENYARPIFSLAWSSTGDRIFTGGEYGLAELFASNGSIVQHYLTLGGSEGCSTTSCSNVLTIDLKYDDSMIVTGQVNDKVTIWNTSSRSKMSVFTNHNELITKVAWSPSGKFVATSSNDLTLSIIDIELNEVIQTFKGFLDPVTSIDWINDSEILTIDKGRRIERYPLDNQNLTSNSSQTGNDAPEISIGDGEDFLELPIFNLLMISNILVILVIFNKWYKETNP